MLRITPASQILPTWEVGRAVPPGGGYALSALTSLTLPRQVEVLRLAWEASLLGASAMASPDARCFTCEVVHASVAGGKLALMNPFENPHMCDACMEPVCYTLPPLLVCTLLSMFLGTTECNWPDSAGGALGACAWWWYYAAMHVSSSSVPVRHGAQQLCMPLVLGFCACCPVLRCRSWQGPSAG